MGNIALYRQPCVATQPIMFYVGLFLFLSAALRSNAADYVLLRFIFYLFFIHRSFSETTQPILTQSQFQNPEVFPSHKTICSRRFTLRINHTSCHVMLRNVASRHVALCRIMSRHFTSCHVMSRHVTSCHVMSRHVPHVTSWHVSRTSCHVMSYHVMSRHVTSRHITSCHILPLHDMTWRHVISCYVISRRKSRDGHATNASLSTDFFHTQSIQIKHDRVRWLSRRLPIQYRISGI